MKTFVTPVPRYIGITDFTTAEQAIQMSKILSRTCSGMKIPPVLMVGIMMSFKTLWDIPNKWTNIFPDKNCLREIFPPYDTPGILNTLHYADFEDHANWPDGQNLFKSLAKALHFGGPNMHCLQLDMTWPDPGAVASAIESVRRPVSVILQIGRSAIADMNYHPELVAEQLQDYEDVVDGVLLDQSMGEGKLMDPALLEHFIRAILEMHPQMHVAIAGGLNNRNLEILRPLLRLFPSLSIDAQAGLRPTKSAMDPVDWGIAESYLVNAGTLFTEYQP